MIINGVPLMGLNIKSSKYLPSENFVGMDGSGKTVVCGKLGKVAIPENVQTIVISSLVYDKMFGRADPETA